MVRDFLGIFGAAFFKAKNAGRQKIDLHSVEEAARDWYETDKGLDQQWNGQRRFTLARQVLAAR